MDLHQIVFGVYPYLCLGTFVLGSWIRFDNEQYTWKSDSSQLLSKTGMRALSNLFHIGVIAIFFGHFVGLLTPHAVFQALGVSDMAHQGIAILAGGIFGSMALIGGVGLWLRRLFNTEEPTTRLDLVDHVVTSSGNAVLTYSLRD